MYVVAPRVALKKAAGTGYTVLSKWPFSHSSMERSLRYVCRNTTRWMGCRNINISVALTYQLLRLIGLSLVWRCLSRGVVCTFNHLLRRYGAVAALGARPQGLTERRSLRTQIFSSLSRSEWVTGKKKVSPQFAQCFILIRFCIPFWRHLLKVLSSKVVTTNQAMTAWRKGQGQVSTEKGRDGKGMCLNEELSRRCLKW